METTSIISGYHHLHCHFLALTQMLFIYFFFLLSLSFNISGFKHFFLTCVTASISKPFTKPEVFFPTFHKSNSTFSHTC